MKRVALALLLGVLLLGCGFLKGLTQIKQSGEVYATQLPQTLEAQKPTLQAMATQVGQMTATTQPTQAMEGAQGDLSEWVQGRATEMENIRTGVERFVHTITVAQKRLVVEEWVHKFDRDKQAEEWVYRKPGQPEQHYVFIQNTFWMQQGKQWLMLTTTVNKQDLQPRFMLWTTQVPQEVTWKKIGTEDIAGIQTTHYRSQGLSLPPSSLGSENIPGMPPLAGPPTVKKVTADIWVAQGYVVRGVVRWEMEFPLANGTKAPGQEEMLWTIERINKPVKITAPKAQQKLRKPPIPLPPEAKLQTHINQPPTWVYQVEGWDLNTAAQYFQEELPGKGFQLQNSYVGEATANFVVQAPNGKRWQIGITTGLGPGVQILIQPAQ